MKRDMELVRKIATELGDSHHELDASLFCDERHDYQDVARHMLMMEDAGLLTVRKQAGDDAWVCCAAVELTWDGNEFLAAARDDATWRKVAMNVAKTVGDVPLSVLTALLKQALMSQLGM